MTNSFLDDFSEQQAIPGLEHRQGFWKPVSFISEVYGVSEQTIRDWIQDGIIEKQNGKLNMLEVVKSVYRHQRSLIEAGDNRGLSDERMQLLKAKREREQLILEKMRGRLLDIDEVKKTAFACGHAVRDSLENIPGRLSSILAAEEDEATISKLLRIEINNTIENLMESDLIKGGASASDLPDKNE